MHEDAGDAGMLNLAAINRAIHFCREACAIALSNDALATINATKFYTNRPAFIRHASNKIPVASEIWLRQLRDARPGHLRRSD
jgi:hypothetical protein